MKHQTRHLLVGAFVVTVAAVAILIWLWFAASARKSYNTYLAIFHEPVDGLSFHALIKYNGVEVGRVKSITLDPDDSRNIFVYLNILQSVHLNKSTYATIKPQGITGLSCVELHLDTSERGIIEPHNEPPFPEINTESSFLYNLSEQAEVIVKNVRNITDKLQVGISIDNLQHINHILYNLDKVTTTVADKSHDIASSIDALKKILQNVEDNTHHLDHMVNDISLLAESLAITGRNANDLILTIKNSTLQNINTSILPVLHQTLYNVDKSSKGLNRLIDKVSQNPSIIIKGQAPSKPGPGE